MSNQIPVFPLGVISFNTDRAVTNPTDVMNHLNAADPPNKDTPAAAALYKVKFNQVDNGAAKGSKVDIHSHARTEGLLIHQHRYNITPIEINFAHHTDTMNYSMQVFVLVPLMGHVLIGAATGNLIDKDKEGNNKLNDVKFYHRGIDRAIYDGQIYISPVPNSKKYDLVFNFTAFGTKSQGSITLF